MLFPSALLIFSLAATSSFAENRICVGDKCVTVKNLRLQNIKVWLRRNGVPRPIVLVEVEGAHAQAIAGGVEGMINSAFPEMIPKFMPRLEIRRKLDQSKLDSSSTESANEDSPVPVDTVAAAKPICISKACSPSLEDPKDSSRLESEEEVSGEITRLRDERHAGPDSSIARYLKGAWILNGLALLLLICVALLSIYGYQRKVVSTEMVLKKQQLV